jgi:heptosyltransferase-2/heptosyltransferase-3
MNLATFSPRRILVCQLRQIGDVLLTTPSIRLLAQRFPAAEIHVFTEAKCAPILEHNPHVSHIWTVPRSLRRALPLWSRLAATGFDLVVDFQQLPRCRMATLLSRARVRLSYPAPWYNRLLYTHTHPPRAGAYAAAFKAGILEALGITWQGEAPEIFLSPEEMTAALHWIQQAGLEERGFWTVDPTHRRPARRWPHFAALVREIHRRMPDFRALFLYGPGEEEEVRRLAAACPPQAVVVPKTLLSLRQMAAVMRLSRGHMGNCSAPRHMAVAVGVPSFTIRGATSGGWRYPADIHQDMALGLACQPCNHNVCPHGHTRCLTDLSPEAVAQAAMEWMQQSALTHCPPRP